MFGFSRKMTGLFLALLAMAIWGCGKGKSTGPDSESSSSVQGISSESQSSSSAHIPAITKSHVVGDAWAGELLESGDTIFYRIPVDSGTPYRIQWNDLYGDSTCNAEVGVNVLRQDIGGEKYWALDRYQGYAKVFSLTALDDTLVVQVRGRVTGVFGLRVLPFVPSFSSSSSRNLSSSRVVSSSSLLNSSSSMSSSSSRVGQTDDLSLGKDWTSASMYSLDYHDFRVPSDSGQAVMVQWVDLDWVSKNFQGTMPGIDVQVEVFDTAGISLSNGPQEVGQAGIRVMGSGNGIRVRVTPSSDDYGSGLFAVRAFAPATKKSVIVPSSNWLLDTVEIGDTLVYKIPPRSNYSQYKFTLELNQESLGDFKSAVSPVGVGPTTWHDKGYVYPWMGYSSDTMLVYVVCGLEGGPSAIKIQEMLYFGAPLLADGKWVDQVIGYGETQQFTVATTPGIEYRVDWTDSEGPEATKYYGNVSVQVFSMSASPYWTDYKGTAGWSVNTIVAVGDSIRVSVKTSSLASYGSYAIRVLPKSQFYRTVSLEPSLDWRVDSLSLGDSIFYQIPVVPGSFYRPEWDGGYVGSKSYGSGVYSYVMNGYTFDSDGSHVFGEADGYSNAILVRPTGTFVTQKFGVWSGWVARGAFAFRMVPIVPIEVAFQSGGNNEQEGYLDPGGMVTYHFSGLATSDLLTLELDDRLDSSNGKTCLCRIAVHEPIYTLLPSNLSNIRSTTSNRANLSALLPRFGELWVSVIPESHGTSGSFAIRMVKKYL
jgi:hypothetical protein